VSVFPITFKGPMIRALIEGRKTQTRRHLFRLDNRKGRLPIERPTIWRKVRVGDLLWVKETWRADNDAPQDTRRTIFRADFDREVTASVKDIIKWKPAIHMPYERSRLTLVVTGVRFDPVHDIHNWDAKAEGVVEQETEWGKIWTVPGAEYKVGRGRRAVMLPVLGSSPRNCFAKLWDTINGSGDWLENPVVAAMTFTVHESNLLELDPAEVAG
jgi:hypothetical protein